MESAHSSQSNRNIKTSRVNILLPISSYSSSFLYLLFFGFVKLAFGAVLAGIEAALSAVTAFE
jgi:hypothetical protein